MSMGINLEVQGTAQVRAMMQALGPQAKTAERLWVTWVGVTAQRAMQAQIPERFSFRNTAEGFKKAIVFQAPKAVQLGGSTARMEGILVVGSDGPGGTKASLTKNLGNILARHEEESSRTSSAAYRMGNQSLVGGFFIPAAGLRTSTTNPPRNLYPTSIGLQMRRGDGADTASAGYYGKSKRKTRKSRGEVVQGASFYAIPDVGIFRRPQHGTGKSSRMGAGEPIWWFVRRVRTPARLRLWETAEEVFNTQAVALGLQAIDEAIYRASL